MAVALLDDQSWRLRKVDSISLLDGRRGRRHCSLDLVCRPQPELAFNSADRVKQSFSDVLGPLMVPIALLSKGVVRDLDVRLPDGRPAPVLTREQNIEVALATLEQAIPPAVSGDEAGGKRVPKLPLDEDLRSELRSIVEKPDADDAMEAVSKLTKVWAFSDPGNQLLSDLAGKFLLVALVPREFIGARTVIKYSHHWNDLPRAWSNVGRLTFAAAGYCTYPIGIVMSGPADAASYHLQVHVPNTLVSKGLYQADGGLEDRNESAVAHGVGHYPEPPKDNIANLHVAVPGRGLRAATILVLLFSFTVFLLERTLPNASGNLMSASDGSAALLLAVPAVAMALLGRDGESDLAATLLGPLRAIIILCSMLMAAAGWSLVGRLSGPWIDYLWCAGACVSGVCLAWLGLGQIVCMVRHDWKIERKVR